MTPNVLEHLAAGRGGARQVEGNGKVERGHIDRLAGGLEARGLFAALGAAPRQQVVHHRLVPHQKGHLQGPEP